MNPFYSISDDSMIDFSERGIPHLLTIVSRCGIIIYDF